MTTDPDLTAPELHVNNDYEESYQYALRLADALRKKHYPDNTDWRPLGDLLGLLTQIDNMVADLCAPTDERVKALEVALQTFIYETTHLSPIEDDGSHWCKISAECLEKGRAALRDVDATP